MNLTLSKDPSSLETGVERNFPLEQWYFAGHSRDYPPKSRTAQQICGVPLVIWRGRSGQLSVLLDRCPHRSAPLSEGKVNGDLLVCPYHGQAFSGAGACVHIPGMAKDRFPQAYAAQAFFVQEQQGLVWIFVSASKTAQKPSNPPYHFPHLGDPGYFSGGFVREYQGHFLDGVENSADTVHTGFVHRGMFYREGDARTLNLEIRSYQTEHYDGVEAVYHGEKVSRSLLSRLIFGRPGSEGEAYHRERFIAPGIHQVEYRMGSIGHVFANVIYTPVRADLTRITMLYNIKAYWLGRQLSFLVKRMLTKVVEQDIDILNLQARNRHQHPGSREISNVTDLMALEARKLVQALISDPSFRIQEPRQQRIQLSI